MKSPLDKLLIKIKAIASSMDIFGLLARNVTICVQENRPTILDSGLRGCIVR